MDIFIEIIAIYLLFMGLIILAMCYVNFIGNVKKAIRIESERINKYNELRKDYVNSVKSSEGTPENNMELMSQMRPSDEVESYVELKYKIGNQSKLGFVAVTDERLIYKTITIGDNTANLNNSLSNMHEDVPNSSMVFDLKEETCNIPIGNVSSMSIAEEQFELYRLDERSITSNIAKVIIYVDRGVQNPYVAAYKGSLSKVKWITDEYVSAYVLKINTQGTHYNLFLGNEADIAKEFVKSFTSITYKK